MWAQCLLVVQDVEHTPASDVYALAVIMCEVFTRKGPYEGEDSDDVLSRIRSMQEPDLRPTLPANMPKAVKSLIEKCWSTDPLHRPDLHAIKDAIANLPGEEVLCSISMRECVFCAGSQNCAWHTGQP